MCFYQDRHRRHGLDLGNFRVEQLFSLKRVVDDGALAAPNHCLGCTQRFAQACWGRGLSLSLEEQGPVIKFVDMLETYHNQAFYLTMYHKNSPLPPRYNPPLTRFSAFHEHLNPKGYVRQLVSAHLHRAYQIFCSPVLPGRSVTSASPLSTDLVGVQYALWELIRELSEPPLAYPLTIIKSALLGFRNKF